MRLEYITTLKTGLATQCMFFVILAQCQKGVFIIGFPLFSGNKTEDLNSVTLEGGAQMDLWGCAMGSTLLKTLKWGSGVKKGTSVYLFCSLNGGHHRLA